MFILGILGWVFLALVALFVFVIYTVEQENLPMSFMVILAAGAIAHFSGTVNMVDIVQDWRKLLLFLGVYSVIGAVWCVVKWAIYTREWLSEQTEMIARNRARFLKLMGIEGDTIPEEHKEAWKDWVYYRYPKFDGIYSDLNRSAPEFAIKDNKLNVTEHWRTISIWGFIGLFQ